MNKFIITVIMVAAAAAGGIAGFYWYKICAASDANERFFAKQRVWRYDFRTASADYAVAGQQAE